MTCEASCSGVLIKILLLSDGAAAGYGFKRIQAHKSGPHDFENVQFGQDLSGYHEGAIWCMKFSLNGRLGSGKWWVG